MERRKFLATLAGLTSTVLVSSDELIGGTGPQDRLGELLPQRKLGRTEETVTMLGVGGSHIGRMGERDAQATIETALEGGVRFFDTAESYGNGRSERYYGRFLTQEYRDVVFLMTKSTGRDAATAREHLEGSLQRLQTDYLDLWQVHSLKSPADVENRIDQGVLDVVREAKESGKVRHVGFTGHVRPSSHVHMLEQTDMFEACQMPINVVDPTNNSFIRQVLPKLVERNLGVLAMKTLADGRFFPGYTDDPVIGPDRLSIEEALHFVWSLPVSVLITGPDTVDQMQEKIDLARSFQRMDEEQRQALIDKVADLVDSGVEYYKA